MPANRSLPNKSLDLWTVLFLCLILVGFVGLFFIYADAGVTWDEYLQATYGDYVLRWYGSFFQDDAALTFWTLPLYGGLFDGLAQLVAHFSPAGLYETRHFLSGIFGLLGLAGTFLLGRHLHSTLAGFLAALFLFLTPRYFGHALMNPKDIPFAALNVFAFYYLLRIVRDFPAPKTKTLIAFGVWTGLTLGMRVGGVFLIGYLALGLLLQFLLDPEKRAWVLARESHAQVILFLKRAAAACLIAYVTMLACWPAAQVDPIRQPLRALLRGAKFTVHDQRVLFGGTMLPANELPRQYVTKWLSMTLPEHYWLGFLLAIIFVIAALRHIRTGENRQRSIEWMLVGVAIAFPLVIVVVLHSVLYDESRHFLFLSPLFAVVAAAPIAQALREPRLRWLGGAALLLAGVSLGFAAKDMVALHPYEYVYFNRLIAGGLPHNFRVNETDYWGASYKEGADWVVQHYPHQPGTPRLKIASCSFPLSTTYYLRADKFEYVGSLDRMAYMTGEPDIFLATTRWNCDASYDGKVVHTVTRQGTPLLFVKEVPPGTPRTRPY